MTLKKMALDDSLGNASSHFFKSGNLISKESENLIRIRNLMPKNGPEKTRVEYDIWYDMGDRVSIHGYSYTDVLGKFIYLRACDNVRRTTIMQKCIKDQIVTEEGKKIFDDLKNSVSDKYSLRRKKSSPEFVIFLPGANIYGDIIDEEKVKSLVSDEGAIIKMHPLTPDGLKTHILHTYGKNNVIEKKISGHQLLESAERVGYSYNSEMGLAAICKNKEVVCVGKNQNTYTYCGIYEAIFDDKVRPLGSYGKHDTAQQRMLNILSSEYNGLISVMSENPKQKINNFFKEYRDLPHVPPKNNRS